MAGFVDLKVGTKVSLGFATLIVLISVVAATAHYNGVGFQKVMGGSAQVFGNSGRV